MNTEGNGGESVPHARHIPHYHGDSVRGMFVVGAILLIVAQSTGAELPLSTTGAVVGAIVLAVAAGITNPRATWIHWVNEFITVWGALLFGTTAVAHYRSGVGILDPSFIYTEALALISLGALYFATRTIRGLHQRPPLL